MHEQTNPQHPGGPAKPDPPGPTVTITVDNQRKEVRRGSWRVSDLKAAVGVDPNRVLDQLIDGKLTELPDDSRVVIHGGEAFVSHVRQGGAA